MATLALFDAGELGPSQQLELGALRGNVLSAQRAIGADLVARRGAANGGAGEAPDLDALRAATAEKERALLDRALVGALELRATLSPPQRSAFALRAKEHERTARRHAAKLAAEGIGGERTALAQARADLLAELAKPVPDETKMRTLGSAFVKSHTRALGAALQEQR